MVKKISNKKFFSQRTDFLLALAPSLTLKRLEEVAYSKKGWKMEQSVEAERQKGIVAFLISSSGESIRIVQGKFGDVLFSSEAIIGLSGMGNEQAVGLGRAVVSFPSGGPQITKRFFRWCSICAKTFLAR